MCRANENKHFRNYVNQKKDLDLRTEIRAINNNSRVPFVCFKTFPEFS